MEKSLTRPMKVTAELLDGRINSPDGILMLDSILYHGWFVKYAPEVLEGGGTENKNWHMGLPLRKTPSGIYAASRGIYTETEKTIETINKRPDFFKAEAELYLADEKGIISSSVGAYRAYRIPEVIRAVADRKIYFWAYGSIEKTKALLDGMPAVGKKYAAGYGIVRKWTVVPCEEDYSLWHPNYGLMRPIEVGSPEAEQLLADGKPLNDYPVMRYGVYPPYWKSKNQRLCYVPVKQ